MKFESIACDFDHTIVDGDKPLPGAKEALQKLRDMGYKIIIHSCNDYEWIQRVLNDNDIPYDEIWDRLGKPICDAYIDDRGIGFAGDWDSTLTELQGLEERRKKIPRYTR